MTESPSEQYDRMVALLIARLADTPAGRARHLLDRLGRLAEAAALDRAERYALASILVRLLGSASAARTLVDVASPLGDSVWRIELRRRRSAEFTTKAKQRQVKSDREMRLEALGVEILRRLAAGEGRQEAFAAIAKARNLKRATVQERWHDFLALARRRGFVETFFPGRALTGLSGTPEFDVRDLPPRGTPRGKRK